MVTTSSSDTASSDTAPLRTPPRVPLLAHQATRFTRLDGCTRELLLWDAGLGKTLMYLAYISSLLQRGAVPRVLVIVPGAALQAQWAAEQRKLAPWLKVHYVGEQGYPCPGTEVADFEVEVTTPQLLRNSLPGYLSKKFDAVVVDELGEFRSGGVQWQALVEACDAATHVWAGTATIVQNHPQEVWHCLRVVAGPEFMKLDEFDGKFTTFSEPRWNSYAGRFETARPNGCKDKPGLGSLIGDYADVLTVADTGLELPVVERDCLWVPVGAQQATIYANTQNPKTKEMIAGFDGNESAVTEVLLPLLAARSGQAVVFCEYRKLVGHVASSCRAAGIETYVLLGQMKASERQQSLASWRASDLGVLVGTEVLELGLNLQTAPDLFSLGSSWNSAREIQREGRIRRIGSPFGTVRHTYLVADLQGERARWKVMQKKMADGDEIMLHASALSA